MEKDAAPSQRSISSGRPPAARIRAAGLRATGPRLAILSMLESDRRHPTAEMVFETLHPDLPSLSLSTVYATLESFVQNGLLRRVHTGEGKLRVDGTVQDHDHAVCRDCGAVFDVAFDLIDRPAAPEVLPAGLKLVGLHIEYEVLCSACSGA